MKFIEVHMPWDDYLKLVNNLNSLEFIDLINSFESRDFADLVKAFKGFDLIDTEKWQVFGVYDEEITAQIRYLYQQIKILKSNEKKAIKTQSDKSPS